MSVGVLVIQQLVEKTLSQPHAFVESLKSEVWF